MTKCEWKDCEVLTNLRFCSQRCRERFQYDDPEWRAKKLVRNKAYNSTHPEVTSRAQKKWYANGGKAIRDAWRENNRDRYNALIRAWARAHPESSVVQCNLRRARIQGAEGQFTVEEWLMLCQQYDYKCVNCGAPEQTADHVVPLSKGGSNKIDNIQPLCKSCNSKKGVRTIDYR